MCASTVPVESSMILPTILPVDACSPDVAFDRSAVDDTHIVDSEPLPPDRTPDVVALFAKTLPTTVTLVAPVFAALLIDPLLTVNVFPYENTAAALSTIALTPAVITAVYPEPAPVEDFALVEVEDTHIVDSDVLPPRPIRVLGSIVRPDTIVTLIAPVLAELLSPSMDVTMAPSYVVAETNVPTIALLVTPTDPVTAPLDIAILLVTDVDDTHCVLTVEDAPNRPRAETKCPTPVPTIVTDVDPVVAIFVCVTELVSLLVYDIVHSNVPPSPTVANTVAPNAVPLITLADTLAEIDVDDHHADAAVLDPPIRTHAVLD
jgi:hypothetical protein